MTLGVSIEIGEPNEGVTNQIDQSRTDQRGLQRCVVESAVAGLSNGEWRAPRASLCGWKDEA